MSSKYERGAGVMLPFFVGYTLANIATGLITLATHQTAGERIHDVQLRNEQLQRELEPAHRVGQLVLNDTDRTFSFVTESSNGASETCTGKYSVGNGTAHAEGDLSCAQTVPVVSHS